MNQITIESESILHEQYSHPSFLPPLWRVIFQEAMRGHHLIFPRAVVESMKVSESYRTVSNSDPDIEEFCVQLFAAPDLRTIRSLIDFLTLEEQKQLFLVYIQLMQSIRDTHKQSIN